MTFFQNQIRARRNTSMLVFLYVLSVLAIIASIYACLMLAFRMSMSYEGQTQNLPYRVPDFWQPDLFTGISLVMLALVVIGTVFKLIQLSHGGASVASMLGGRLIPANSNDPLERKILNIVEEMSIASGVPVPQTYMLDDEDSINAFAAGFNIKNAVIGVTRGCVKQLNRDELQGVIAHEFSHILNGDMRLNIRLLATLNGILMISMLGYALWRIGIETSPRRSYSRDDNKGNPAAFLLIAGIVLYVLGYLGVFFARLIQSAVSRQREFLADASAVQFTRNPSGIGNALAKIGLLSGSVVQNRAAQETSHFFFANGLTQSFFNLFATHPPILERIRQIDSNLARKLQRIEDSHDRNSRSFNPEQLQNDLVSALASNQSSSGPSAQSNLAWQSDNAPHAPQSQISEISASIGEFHQEHIEYAKDIIARLPQDLLDAAHNPSAARAIICALLLNKDAGARSKQVAHLKENSDSLLLRDLAKMADFIEQLPTQFKLPLAAIATPALRAMNNAQYAEFRKTLQVLIEADAQCSIFEYSLQHMLRRHLDPFYFSRPKPGLAAIGKLEEKEAAYQLIASLAHLTNPDNLQAANQAFQSGMAQILENTDNVSKSQMKPSLKALDDALYALEDAAPRSKERILKACIATICADKVVNTEESELIRAIADGLDCPLPPFEIRM